jgi:hypothetical protein
MAAVSSSEDSSENTRNSRSVLGDLLSELHLDFCAQDFASYMKVDVSSQVNKVIMRLVRFGRNWAMGKL